MKRNHTPFASRLSSNYTFPSNPETSSVNSSKFVMFMGCFLRNSGAQRLRSSGAQKLSVSGAQRLSSLEIKSLPQSPQSRPLSKLHHLSNHHRHRVWRIFHAHCRVLHYRHTKSKHLPPLESSVIVGCCE